MHHLHFHNCVQLYDGLEMVIRLAPKLHATISEASPGKMIRLNDGG